MGVDRDRVCGVGDVHRSSLQGHAGFPADHEFFWCCRFLFVGACFRLTIYRRAVVCDLSIRSRMSGWIARCAHWHVALWRDWDALVASVVAVAAGLARGASRRSD